VAVFLLELIIINSGGQAGLLAVFDWLALDPVDVFTKVQVWQLVTYMFLHSPTDIFHLAWNMLLLWMFGSDVERTWGTRRFTRYYLITGIGAGVANCAFRQPQTIGASGAVIGVIVAFAMLFPTRTVHLMGIFPLTARQLAVIIIVIELFSLGVHRADGVARIAHLGGAVTGYLLIKGGWDPRRLWYDLRWKMRRRRFKTIKRDDEDDDRFYPYH
jgi:membrane associated rhomboid family serine protease